jgi:hypothetical protein
MSDNLFNTGTSTSDKTGPIADLGNNTPSQETLTPNPKVPGDGTHTVAELQKALDGSELYSRIEKDLHY